MTPTTQTTLARPATATLSEPPSGLPIPLFWDAHVRRCPPERKLLSRALPWGGGTTFSVYLEDIGSVTAHLAAFMEPAWASLRQFQADYARQLADAEYYADALHNLDIDPAASQDWTIRTYTLSTTPDDSIPVFHPDDFDFED